MCYLKNLFGNWSTPQYLDSVRFLSLVAALTQSRKVRDSCISVNTRQLVCFPELQLHNQKYPGS